MMTSPPDLAILKELRPLLLKSHKLLMEAEKTRYEAIYGPIPTKGEYLRLVLHHEQFSWLRPFAQLIVQIDEVLMAKTPLPPERSTEVLHQARNLLQASEIGEAFEVSSQALTYQDPEIAPMLARLTALLR
jgi:hypothetical protein